MTRSKFALRAGAAVAGTLAIAALALPAIAATGDIDGYKSWYFDDNERELPAVDGDLLWFYTYNWNESGNLQENVVFNDYMEDGLEYVAQSTDVYVTNYIQTAWSYATPDNGESTVTNGVAKDALLAISVAGDTLGTRYSSPGVDTGQGNGWIGAWYEENDVVNDGVDIETDGVVRSYGGAGGLGDNNSISFTGPVAAPANVADTSGPALVRQFNADDWEDLQLIFQTNGAQLDPTVEEGDSDTLGVWVSGDGSAWTYVTTLEPGAANATRIIDIGSVAGDETAFIRVGPNSALEAGEIWGVDNFIIAGVKAQYSYYDNDASGLNNLDNGAPPSLVTSADSIDLNPLFTFNGESYESNMSIYYQATVETAAAFEYDTYLENEVEWRSDAYGLDEEEDPEFDIRTTGVDVLYDPEIDITVTSNGPVQTGQPIIITVVFEHGDDSDGSPVCLDDPTDVTYPAGSVAVNKVQSPGNLDNCLEEGEKWTFTITYPGQASAGTVPFAAALSGFSVNAGQEDDFDVNVNASTDVVVVLADTGAANTGVAGVAAALVALGAAALVVARRRNA